MAIEGMFETSVAGILKKLGTKHISMAWGAKDAIKELKDKLEMIQAVTRDAEQKQMTDQAVKLWLKWLKNVAYDADDVLDEFSYEVMRQNAKVPSSSNPSTLFLLKMSRKIKDINKRLDEITSYMVRFDLEPTHNHVDYDQDTEDRITSSLIGNFKVVGREKDRSHIVETLLMTNPSISSSENRNPQEKIHVVSIVGMGGLGKTSLAQYVYKDDSINRTFKKKAWVCVSEIFDIFYIIENILESLTEKKSTGVSNVDVLVRQVHEHIAGEKYLIVLDDVWNENAEEWEKLIGLLRVGAPGSKILVTTRSDHVASIIRGIIPPYSLTALSNEHCWSIIKYRAFSPGGAVETATMTKIGEEIATKCSGLPLAANFLGSLMHLKRKESDWLEIRDNGIFNTPETPNRIIRILKLSYDNLPAHLKQCFSYCCLFPKDWVFRRDHLIHMCMAEGFLHTYNGGGYRKSLEDIGNGHLHRLLSSSFFQDVKKDVLGDIETFKMHDLVHDLALSVVGSHEATILKASDTENYSSDIRRARLVLDQKSFPKVLNNAEKLRTLFYRKEDELLLIPVSNKKLRVLFSLGIHGLEIPSTPFQLKHLRYLQLSSSAIEKVHVSSISQLYNLQVMYIMRCKNVQKIIKEISSLKNLRHLDLSYSDVEVLPDSILSLTNLQTLSMDSCFRFTALPLDIGFLQQLSTLDVSRTPLRHLPDSITSIYNLRRLELQSCSDLETLPRNLGTLTQLRVLDLAFTRVKELPDSFTSNLCNLELVNLGDKCNFPRDIKNWVQLRSLRYNGRTKDAIMPRGIETLTYLKTLLPFIVMKKEGAYIGGSSSSSIEELAALNSLQELHICNLENVRGGTEEAQKANLKDNQDLRELKLSWKHYIYVHETWSRGRRSRKLVGDCDEEVIFGSLNEVSVLEGLQPHPNLERLIIEEFYSPKFPNWVGGNSSSTCLPNLVRLELWKCINCEKLPALGMLPCLKELVIMGFNSVKCLGNEFYYEQEGSSRERADNNVEEASSNAQIFTTTLSLFPSLVSLEVTEMQNLEEWAVPPPSLWYVNCFPVLEYVKIKYCPLLKSLPDISKNSSGPTFMIAKCKKLYEGESVSVGEDGVGYGVFY